MFAVGGGRRTVSSRGSPSRTISNLLCIGFGGAVSVMGIFLGFVTHRGYFVVTLVTLSILLIMACCAMRDRWCRLLDSVSQRTNVRGDVSKTSPPAVASATCSACSSTCIRMEQGYGSRSLSVPNMAARSFRDRGCLKETRNSGLTRSHSAL